MYQKVYGWFCIILGGYVTFNGIAQSDSNSLLGGIMFLAAGLIIVDLIKVRKS